MNVLHLEVSVLTVLEVSERVLGEGAYIIVDVYRERRVGLGMELEYTLISAGKVILGHKLEHRLATDGAEGRLLGDKAGGELSEELLIIRAIGSVHIVEHLTDEIGVVGGTRGYGVEHISAPGTGGKEWDVLRILVDTGVDAVERTAPTGVIGGCVAAVNSVLVVTVEPRETGMVAHKLDRVLGL